MCGRFILKGTWAEIYEWFNLIPGTPARNIPARYNIAPTQEVLFVTQGDGGRALNEGRWWLVPHWAKEIPKYALFNARSEDAAKKPAFRDAFKWGRCLIPANGYYEWTKAEDGGKDPHLIHLPENELFGFAGLWARNEKLGLLSCTILTAAAHSAIEHLHHRMPIVLNREVWDGWLDVDEVDASGAQALLSHNRGSDLTSYRVGRAVNSSRAEGPELIDGLGPRP